MHWKNVGGIPCRHTEWRLLTVGWWSKKAEMKAGLRSLELYGLTALRGPVIDMHCSAWDPCVTPSCLVELHLQWRTEWVCKMFSKKSVGLFSHKLGLNFYYCKRTEIKVVQLSDRNKLVFSPKIIIFILAPQLNVNCFQKCRLSGTRGMAQWLKALAALAEDPDWVFSTHITANNCP